MIESAVAPAKIHKVAAPTVAFNAAVPQMDIPEKSYVVGALTNKIHAVIGDNPAGPETVTITPPGGMPKRARIGGPQMAGAQPAPEGAVSFASGGSIEVGPGGRTRDQVTGTDYLSDEERAWYLGQSTNIDANAQNFLNTYNQPVQQPAPVATIAATGGGGFDPLEAQRQAQQAAIDARGGVAMATQGQINANTGVINATANQLPYKEAVYNAQGAKIGADANVLNAQAGVTALRPGQIDAQGRVIDAQGNYTAEQRAQIQRVQAANAQRLAEEQRVQAAAANVADQTAVAQAQNTRNNEDYKYGLAGLSTPVEVATANGADANLPTGTRAKLQTQEQLVSKESQQNERLRQIQLDQAQQIVNLAATNVDAAQQAAARVGLTIDRAQVLVDEAQIAAGRAGLDVNSATNAANIAGLDVDRAQIEANRADQSLAQANLGVYNGLTAVQQSQMPPQGVPAGYQVVTDPFTGQSQYMSAADAALKQNQDKMKLAQMLNSETPLAAFSESQLLSIYAQGLQTGVQQDAFEQGKVSAELQRRGYTQEQAHALTIQAEVAALANKNKANQLPTKDEIAQDLFSLPYNQLGEAGRKAVDGVDKANRAAQDAGRR